jgi:hypothetical protein
MRSFRRALPFLLLNIFLSAATTLAILYWVGGGFHISTNQAPSPTLAAILQPTEARPLPTPTSSSASGQQLIEIVEVQGSGDLNNETVLFSRLGEGDLRLTGWKLEDNAGHHFTFPEFVLNQQGKVQVSTRTGQNTAIALFWGLEEAVWTLGKTVYLYDPQGAIQATLVVK